MPSWLNNDGLLIKYGTDEGVSTFTAAEYEQDGPTRFVYVEVPLALLTSTATILSDVVVIPKGAQIEMIEVITEVAGATGTSFDIGIVGLDRSTVTGLSAGATDAASAATAIINGMPLASFNAVGERTQFTNSTTVPASATGTGTCVGNVLTNPVRLTGRYPTGSAFTAGRVKVRIRYAANALLTN